jgi:hypothetical protein
VFLEDSFDTEPATVDVIEQFVHQHEGRAVGQKGPDHIPTRRHPFLVVLSHRRERFLPAKLPGDLAPGRIPKRFAAAATTGERVELGPDKDGRRGLGHVLDLGELEDISDTLPILRRWPRLREVVE